MKKKHQSILSKAFNYFFEFVVVFFGVFLAFWLSEYKDKKDEDKKKAELYKVVYEELNSFYESGKKENEKGFINFFRNLDKKSDSLIVLREIPIKTNLYGDYWKIPIISSFVQNGMLKDIDIETYKKIARFHTIHQNFLENIQYYNTFYDKYITAEYNNGINSFYLEDSNQLKPKYSYLEDALYGISEFAELLVEASKNLSEEIKEKHMDKNPD